ncbi:MAG TPA: glycosyltransferase family 2 protein [Cytophagales bacterium]|jgi:glycosyltransferase involved in cell wall biosynthesis
MHCPSLAALPPPPPGKTGWPWTEEGPAPAAREGDAWPAISIVTPSYNQGRYLEQTIRSVLLQGYPALEYIVVDGGSTDDSVAILRKYAPWITYWASEPDGGQTDAINKGFARCTGEVFNWLNSDDYYEPGALLAVGRQFADPRVEVVCGRERVFEDVNPSEGQLHPGSTVRERLEETLFTAHIDQPVTFFRRSAIAGHLPLSVSLKYLMDVQLWLSYLLAAGQDHIARVPDVLVNFRLHGQSKTVAQAAHFAQERAALLGSLGQRIGVPDYILALLPRGPGLGPAGEISGRVDAGRLVALYARKYAGTFYNRGQYHHCRRCIYLAVKHEPRRLREKGFFRLALLSLLPAPVLNRVRRAPARP